MRRSFISPLRAITLLSLIVLFSTFLSSFSSNQYTALPKDVISDNVNQLRENIQVLDKAATNYKFGKTTLDSLKEALSQTRISYKKVEFYLAYQYPEYTIGHFNGAPLLQIEKEGTRPKVITPEGLQVLDELIFSDEATDEKNNIAAIAKKLYNSFETLYSGFSLSTKNINWAPAMRLELVRIFALGVTGFDTPGSLNIFNEGAAALAGMNEYFTATYTGDENKKTGIISLLKRAETELKQQASFNDFDRLTFLKQYIDPLYNQLGNLNITQSDVYLSNSSSWNPQSQSVFANDFLNPYYFTQLTKKEDSKNLRELGKMLFYDPVVSNNGTVSCASCHQPEKAFTDGIPKSLSNVQGKTVLRNAPTLLNAVYSDRYFYDLRAFTLEQQAEHVIFNPDEFNTAYSAIIHKLQQDKKYNKAFKDLFGKNSINRENFSKALASYVLSLQSFNSDFDKYARGETATIDTSVKNGFNLFMGKANCATCHFVPTFAGLVPPLYNENESEILGVLNNPESNTGTVDPDEGRIANEVYSEYAWIYEKSFKTSTVRNAGLTAPYFHNGAYKTLEEVIDFYNEGGGSGLGHTVTNQTLPADKLGLSEKEKRELIAFINSLNDTTAAKKDYSR